MFDKHKEAQTTSLNDIQQEVKSLKSLLARRSGQSETSLPSSSTTSPPPPPTTPSSSIQPPQPIHPSYSPYTSASPYSASGRLGSRTGSSSSSFANIANRPPGIPAWQMQNPTLQSSQTEASLMTGSEEGKENSESTPHINEIAGSEYEEVKKSDVEDVSAAKDSEAVEIATADISA